MKYTENKIKYYDNFSKEFLTKVLERLTIEKVADYYHLKLNKQEDSILLNCPFHEDHSESLVYDVKKEYFECSVCGKKGNLVDFVQEMEKDTNIKFFLTLAKITNVTGDDLTTDLNENSTYIRCELCARSGNSLYGVGSVANLVERAKAYGINALALCDDYSTNGYDAFYNNCAKQHIDAIYGATINVEGTRVAVLAKNKNGISDINRVISESTFDKKIKDRNNSLDSFKRIKSYGNIISIGIADSYENVAELLNNFDFIGIKPTNKTYPEILNSKSNFDKVVAISDSYFCEPNDGLLYDVLTNRTNDYSRKLRSYNELAQCFPLNWVGDNCTAITKLIEDDCFKPTSTYLRLGFENLITEDGFKKLVEEKALDKYGKLTQEVQERLNQETKCLIDSGHYQIVYVAYKYSQIIDKRNGKHYPRGKVGSLLINYVLGISSFDPMKYDLPYQMGIGFHGEMLPCYTFNISTSDNGKAFSDFESILGEGNVAKAGSVLTYNYREALKMVSNFIDSDWFYYPNIQDVKIFKLENTTRGVASETMFPGKYFFKPSGHDFNELTPILNNTTLTDYRNLWTAYYYIDALGNIEVDIEKEFEKRLKVNFNDIPIDDKEVFKLFKSDEPLKKTSKIYDKVDSNGLLLINEFGTEFVMDICSKCKITTIDDLIKISCIAHATGLWHNNIEVLMQNGVALSDCLTSEDEIYTTLIKKYVVDPYLAYKVAYNVKKGRGISKSIMAQLSEYKIPRFLLYSLNMVKYLFPKAHAVSYTLTALREMHIKIYHPKDFYEVIIPRKVDLKQFKEMLKLSNDELLNILASTSDTKERSMEIINSLNRKRTACKLVLELRERNLECKITKEKISIVEGK